MEIWEAILIGTYYAPITTPHIKQKVKLNQKEGALFTDFLKKQSH